MLVSLRLFNAFIDRVKLNTKAYCTLLDTAFSTPTTPCRAVIANRLCGLVFDSLQRTNVKLYRPASGNLFLFDYHRPQIGNGANSWAFNRRITWPLRFGGWRRCCKFSICPRPLSFTGMFSGSRLRALPSLGESTSIGRCSS